MLTDRRRKNHIGPSGTQRRFAGPWMGVIVSVVVVVVGVVLILPKSGGGPTASAPPEESAMMFELATSTGSSFVLEDALVESDVLLYFSMGIGCDGCFAQIPEVAKALDDRLIALVPVMVQDPDAVNTVARQWGIEQPIVIDADLAVSEAYGMLGINDHTDRPFHSIALVKQDRSIALLKHYDTMFVGVDEMMEDIAAAG